MADVSALAPCVACIVTSSSGDRLQPKPRVMICSGRHPRWLKKERGRDRSTDQRIQVQSKKRKKRALAQTEQTGLGGDGEGGREPWRENSRILVEDFNRVVNVQSALGRIAIDVDGGIGNCWVGLITVIDAGGSQCNDTARHKFSSSVSNAINVEWRHTLALRSRLEECCRTPSCPSNLQLSGEKLPGPSDGTRLLMNTCGAACPEYDANTDTFGPIINWLISQVDGPKQSGNCGGFTSEQECHLLGNAGSAFRRRRAGGNGCGSAGVNQLQERLGKVDDKLRTGRSPSEQGP